MSVCRTGALDPGGADAGEHVAVGAVVRAAGGGGAAARGQPGAPPAVRGAAVRAGRHPAQEPRALPAAAAAHRPPRRRRAHHLRQGS